MGIVYKITNSINNKCYIGISKNTFRKRYNHRDDWWNAPSVNKILKQSIEKHGYENFKVEILENCEKTELEEKEKYYINKFNSFIPNGYNLTTGGSYSYEVSIESKLKNSETNKNRYKNGAVVWNKGKKLTKVHKEKNSKTKKKLYNEGKLIPWNKGKKIGPMKKSHILKSAKAHKKQIKRINKTTLEVEKIYEGLIDAKCDGFNPSCISQCCKKKLKSHKGYFWEYLK
tara:strand:- start:708 stop:1394 length:687 start_codon:yes stop_codon:yes gene_type:complete